MRKYFSIATLGSIILFIIMRWQGSTLKTTTSSRAIIDLEFADSALRLHELLIRWDITVVRINIWIDFLFIIAYTIFLSVAAEIFASKWPEKSLYSRMGYLFARLAFTAGIFDIAENLLMLQSVSGNYTGSSLQLTFYCASIKFILVALIFIYLIISLLLGFRRKL